MQDEEVLKAIQQIAVDQGKVVASLTGHVDLDNERFRGMNDKLDRIDRRTEQTAKDVESLKATRSFQRGVRWTAVKVASVVSFVVSALGIVAAWAGIIPWGHR